MSDHVKEVLQNAIEANERVDIIYLGGSKPGSSRSIAPISISNDRVRAKCYSSNMVKYFDIKKIKLPSSSPLVRYEDYTEKKYKTTQDVFDDFCVLYPDTRLICNYTETNISIFGYVKNGKRKSKRSISIEYYEKDPDTLSFRINANFEMESYKPKTRPWHVSGPLGNTIAYSDLHKAAMEFFKRLSIFTLECVD
ncbi:hypothetical protein FZH48_16935 [Salmonella enterica]|nr:hypothetical protein [Salmonella enterica]ECG1719636.1 hypothetical protein [Salmonella enterica subsp. diarizonae serovar 17:z10:e,n,x,z15]EDY2188495.1 hypothetical protein [Salmonella enterica subsp. enterica]EEJ6653582.1 hypothetical protein [Salmonella enterica subsp. enterica serovar Redlands]EAO9177012.1 hypothetical protein [Salmonella enterica]